MGARLVAVFGDELQRSSYFFEIPGDINLCARLRNELKKLRVMVQAPGTVEAAMHIIGRTLAVNVFAECDNVCQPECDLSTTPMLEGEHLSSPVAFYASRKTFGVTGIGQEGRILLPS